MKIGVRVVLVICLICLFGCGKVDLPARQHAINQLPELSGDMSRVYFLSGTYQMKGGLFYHPDPVKIKEGGDVYVNRKLVGYFYRDEIIVVDLTPGAYVVNWVTKLGDFDVKHTESVPYTLVIKSGEIKYLVANKIQGSSSGYLFGAIGALSDSALLHTYFVEEKSNKEEIMKGRRIVDYIDFNNK